MGEGCGRENRSKRLLCVGVHEPYASLPKVQTPMLNGIGTGILMASPFLRMAIGCDRSPFPMTAHNRSSFGKSSQCMAIELRLGNWDARSGTACSCCFSADSKRAVLARAAARSRAQTARSGAGRPGTSPATGLDARSWLIAAKLVVYEVGSGKKLKEFDVARQCNTCTGTRLSRSDSLSVRTARFSGLATKRASCMPYDWAAGKELHSFSGLLTGKSRPFHSDGIAHG